MILQTSDSGSFEAIQIAGMYALEHTERNAQINETYKRRLEILVDSLNKVGLNAQMPEGTFYLFVEAPIGTSQGDVFDCGEAFSQWLITEKGIVTVPWDDNNEHNIRFSATFGGKGSEHEKEICSELVKRLEGIEFTY